MISSERHSHMLLWVESSVSRSLAHEVDSLVDSSHWGDIDSLSSKGTTGTNSSGVLSGTALDDGLEEHGEWVLASDEMDHLKSLLEDSDSHLLLTVLSMHTDHQHVGESLSDWAVDLGESDRKSVV